MEPQERVDEFKLEILFSSIHAQFELFIFLLLRQQLCHFWEKPGHCVEEGKVLFFLLKPI